MGTIHELPTEPTHLKPSAFLPCPFCGEKEDIEINESGTDGGDPDVFVQCGGCQTQGPPARIGCRDDDEEAPIDLEAEAVELWNTRA